MSEFIQGQKVKANWIRRVAGYWSGCLTCSVCGSSEGNKYQFDLPDISDQSFAVCDGCLKRSRGKWKCVRKAIEPQPVLREEVTV